MSEHSSALAAKANAVSVLQSQTEAISSGGNAAQSEISVGPFATDAVVLASASGSAAYKAGELQGAGIIVTLFVDGEPVARDDSFEGTSSSISFRASLSYNLYLSAKQSAKVLAKVEPYGAGGKKNENTRVRLDIIALAAKKT